MNRIMVILAASLVAALALSGCASKAEDADLLEVVPQEINETQLQRIEALADETVTRDFSFPGQEALPTKLIDLSGVLAPMSAPHSPEIPDDDGVADYNRHIVAHDLSGETATGQPVELRITLKWSGNPGASADLDIYTNVPGDVGSYQADRYDESMNWNIVTKTKVVDTLLVEGHPFEVGFQVANSKDMHPDGIEYQLLVEMHFAKDVLTPGVPYAIQVPEGAGGLLLESEPVTGDEHIDSQYILVGPNDELVRTGHWNDIATEQLFVPVRSAGEHILYFHKMHGGFLRLSTDVPLETPEARALTRTVTDMLLFSSGAPLPGTYVEQGEASGEEVPNEFGATGSIDARAAAGGALPLDVTAFVRPTGGSADAALNITGANGWLHTAFALGTLYEDQNGRIGMRQGEHGDRISLTDGDYQYGIVVNGHQVDVGYTVVSYER